MAPNVPSMAARPFWSSHVRARLRAVTPRSASERVTAGDGAGEAVVAGHPGRFCGPPVYWAAEHGADLGEASEGDDLEEAGRRDVGDRRSPCRP